VVGRSRLLSYGPSWKQLLPFQIDGRAPLDVEGMTARMRTCSNALCAECEPRLARATNGSGFLRSILVGKRTVEGAVRLRPDRRCPGVGKRWTSAPISAISVCATSVLTPGMVERRSPTARRGRSRVSSPARGRHVAAASEQRAPHRPRREKAATTSDARARALGQQRR
jgi:hypothetical protein